ncbi:MAG: thioesterase family protein [Parvibaculum sp.]|uniref:thioesterase family protein n=1 Tax=Parvibaculum sp. TaxID=2024848 RepID=UPI0032671F05
MTDTALAAPFECPLRTVEHEWVDYNGHLNMAYYHVLFDQSLDTLFNELGIGWDYTKQGEGSCFTAEVHVCYLDELLEGDEVRITYQVLDADAKRVHVFAHMYHAEKGYLAATSEQMCIHVDMKTRRAAPFPEASQKKIEALAKAHAGLAKPEQAGRVIGIKRK